MSEPFSPSEFKESTDRQRDAEINRISVATQLLAEVREFGRLATPRMPKWHTKNWASFWDSVDKVAPAMKAMLIAKGLAGIVALVFLALTLAAR